ncbi:MAG: transcription antitermination factor NusB [Christensenellales bacterium]
MAGEGISRRTAIRRNAREAALKLLYENAFGVDGGDLTYAAILESLADHAGSPVIFEEAERNYIDSIVSGVKNSIPELDERIGKYAIKWTVKRMPIIDLCILRMAVWEMLAVNTTPVSVAINEAVELAKKYGSDKAPPFVNGVLGKVAAGLNDTAEDTDNRWEK